MRENIMLFAMMSTPWSKIHIRKDGSSNSMITQLAWFYNSSMRKYQWEWKKGWGLKPYLFQKNATTIAAVTPIWFQNTMISISHVIKKVKGSSSWSNHKRRQNNVQSLLKAANDATILASSAFPVSMINNILTFPPLAIHSSSWQPWKFVKTSDT